MEIKWLRNALRNLEQAHAYIVKDDDPEAARQLILRIQGSVGQLAEFPLIGRVGRVEGTRELVISNTSYLAIYRVKQETVEVLRVLHASRKYPDN
ncbi:MAG: type II toxin-antitoxin system RelE/ParE family toxin [Microcoleus sp. PH2017_10_PVI_O_A]|uniref:type II toxin-antitoxin system RelE/ParE family toxin n=1 Tax=unclassified Microcoleus TaxID=2642155 RepID=UPI001DD0E647|nr:MULTISPECIES: type II toxin-antitoxin system RelE/ParE family toxin [unclassified Microcoleus]TAE80599.1 MAG: type II toxin-antitoxin system RelE/ParE family toxin [Oscillatoriales cyanobacterium]MCC3408032.1 type II toxin-antitoxin system RelE/ParE family toxin [Microcoleus sp. PH2017_10_PVI_O_A]MCC3462152.1 type II toxin-antitoxin system RelE/ParE family toxin [Microcoleus sp. PH2017_11_PCY_U_A]MCC3480585.1 type II toxin-antitoxin system RelE/ParE family toxin [Microcoleus sp. PH2017_12_PC